MHALRAALFEKSAGGFALCPVRSCDIPNRTLCIHLLLLLITVLIQKRQKWQEHRLDKETVGIDQDVFTFITP